MNTFERPTTVTRLHTDAPDARPPGSRRRLRYTAHALQRLGERGILRRWVDAATRTRPTCYGKQAVFVLSADQLRQHFGDAFSQGIRVVIDVIGRVVVTVHWFPGSSE